jgi:mRNA-degrading endonuclease toxin of MazEF toxin-antitoxin module
MPFPQPEPGLVISYSYLWRHEHNVGKKEGRKIRPCVIILSVEERNGEKIVTVAPITHTRSADSQCSVEIPSKVKRHLNLDDDRSWVVLDEVNQFSWPGFDLQPFPGSKTRYDFGFIPPKLFEKIRAGMLDLFIKRRVESTNRD